MNRRFKGLAIALVAGGLAAAILVTTGREEPMPPEMGSRANPVGLSDSVLAAAKGSYGKSCLPCHGESGSGDGPMAAMQSEPPPDLAHGNRLIRMSDGAIYWVISRGKKPSMPPFRSKLTEEEIWSLVHLMRRMSRTAPAQR
jgi:mono/diheme cytochrome c family protein